MNGSPLGISKKIAKIYFVFGLLSFFMQKTGGMWKRRQICQFRLTNLKGL
jgi:hypothetical protein